MQGRHVFIVDAVRTPVARFGGAFAEVRPDDLAAVVIRSLLERTTSLDPARIGEVYFGAANQAGEDNRNVARMASLLAGLPPSVPGSTVNRLCGSSLDAVIGAARTIAVGDASIMVAGGSGRWVFGATYPFSQRNMRIAFSRVASSSRGVNVSRALGTTTMLITFPSLTNHAPGT